MNASKYAETAAWSLIAGCVTVLLILLVLYAVLVPGALVVVLGLLLALFMGGYVIVKVVGENRLQGWLERI